MCALHGTKMSLLFREGRFREEGKMGAFGSSQISIPLLCACSVMLGPDHTGWRHIASAARQL